MKSAPPGIRRVQPRLTRPILSREETPKRRAVRSVRSPESLMAPESRACRLILQRKHCQQAARVAMLRPTDDGVLPRPSHACSAQEALAIYPAGVVLQGAKQENSSEPVVGLPVTHRG